MRAASTACFSHLQQQILCSTLDILFILRRLSRQSLGNLYQCFKLRSISFCIHSVIYYQANLGEKQTEPLMH